MGSLFLTTGDSLRIVSSTAAVLDIAVFQNRGRSLYNIAKAGTYDVFDALSECEIETLVITNKTTSVPTDVTVQLHTMDGSQGTCDLYSTTTVIPGQSLSFADGAWVVPAKTKLNMTQYVTANSVHATAATFAVITGLTVPVLAGHNYAFEACIFHISNATTTGCQIAIGGVAATYVIIGEISTILNSVTNATMGTGCATAVDTAAIVETTGAAANAPSWVAGFITPSASGDLSLKATSEVSVAAGLTILKGSWFSVRETDN